jgi:signal transduction histidine kinase
MGYGEIMSTSAPRADPRNGDSVELNRLAEEQAALRRVATLVAEGAAPTKVFAAVAAEVAQLIPADGSALTRYEPDGTVTALGGWTADGGYRYVGTSYPLEGTVSGRVFEMGRAARVDDYAEAPGKAPDAAREMGWRSSVGAPITVGGRLWGVLAVVSTSERPLPPDTEWRLVAFTELIATAIANAESHEALAQLAEEQAALRRVATLVAEGAQPNRVFAAVADEVASLLGCDTSAVMRFETDGSLTVLGGHHARRMLGERFAPDPDYVLAAVRDTGRAARFDTDDPEAPGMPEPVRSEGIRSGLATPIAVDGVPWGLITVASLGVPLPPGTDGRLANFTELIATAIANSQAHEQLAQLADEQAALRRVATLVAEGAAPDRVFDAVRHEVARMFDVPLSMLTRYDANGTVTLLATSDGFLGPVGRSWSVEGDSSATARVCRTGLPARAEYSGPMQGPIAAGARAEGGQSAVAVPVVVEGTLWGVMAVGTREPEPLPADLEDRLAKFTELLATAIANAEGRAEVDASRARIVAAADATRRRIERDLHDGAQQQLVWLALALRAAQATVPEELEQHRSELGRVVDGLTSALDDLREIALGIHPAGLSEDGLAPALKRVVARSPLRVNLDVRAGGRFPEPVEVTAYYVVSEALTNAAKYADVPVVDVAVAAENDALHVEVRDGGCGGADPAEGSGLVGLRDRVEAIGGTMRLTSPPGAGTSLRVELPLVDQASRR